MRVTSSSTGVLGHARFSEQARERVNQALNAFLPSVDPNPAAACPARLAEAMRYSVLSGGKRLRPTVVLMAAESCGCDPAQALPAACAIEMVHTYSLIHDDLPAMDDDDLRRGRPTCHKAFDEATAILAGDALLTLAFEVLAQHLEPPEASRECILYLAQAAGAHGMVGGQMADLEAETGPPGDLNSLEAIHRRKTGALLRASLRMGAAVAQAPAQERRALDAYGQAIGLAFQIVDDVLDVEGDQTKLGKRVQKDSNLGKRTYPGLLGVAASRERARLLAEEAVAALEPLESRADHLRELAWDLLGRDR